MVSRPVRAVRRQQGQRPDDKRPLIGMQPDFAKQCQCKPNAERGKLACMSYAEVQPDFAEGNN